MEIHTDDAVAVMPSPAASTHRRKCIFARKRGPSTSPLHISMLHRRHVLTHWPFRLKAIQAKLAEQRKHIDDLDKHMYAPPCTAHPIPRDKANSSQRGIDQGPRR